MITIVASTLVLLASTATASPARPDSADPSRFRSADALRHYVQGRLLEERGETDAATEQFYHVLVSDPHGAAAARHVSELAARSGDPVRSLEFARRALAIDSTDARARWLEGVALFQQNQREPALASLIAATRLDSSSAEYLQALAHVAQEMGRFDLQEDALRRLIDLRDDDGEAWFQIAALSARRGHFAAADSALDEAARLNPDRPGIDFLRGWVDESLGRDSLAISAYRRHLAAHEGDQATRRRMVTLLARQRRFSEAYHEAGLVSRANEGDADALLVEAELAFSAGATDAGRALATRLEREHGEDLPLITRLVAVLVRENRTQDALALADRWAAAHPGDYHGPLLQARAALLAQQNSQALARAHTALSLAPDSLETREMLARVYQSQKKWGQAESVWVEAGRRFPDVDRIPLQLSYCREQKGDIDGAVSAVRDLLQREPDNAEALNSLGYLFADHNRDLHEAEKMIARALEQEPDNGAFLDSMGWVHFRLGKVTQARTELERAVELTGGDPEICEHLGDVYKQLGLNDLARQLYRRSLQRDNSNTRVRAKLEGDR